jgi:hypothetical protein
MLSMIDHLYFNSCRDSPTQNSQIREVPEKLSPYRNSLCQRFAVSGNVYKNVFSFEAIRKNRIYVTPSGSKAQVFQKTRWKTHTDPITNFLYNVDLLAPILAPACKNPFDASYLRSGVIQCTLNLHSILKWTVIIIALSNNDYSVVK